MQGCRVGYSSRYEKYNNKQQTVYDVNTCMLVGYIEMYLTLSISDAEIPGSELSENTASRNCNVPVNIQNRCVLRMCSVFSFLDGLLNVK